MKLGVLKFLLLAGLVLLSCVVAGYRLRRERADAGPAKIAPALATAVSRGPVVKVYFAGGLACEGREGDIPAAAWQVSCGAQALAVSGATAPVVELPAALATGGLRRLVVRVPGWSGAEVELPPAGADGSFYLAERVFLRREMAGLALAMPAAGTDYDVAEVVWVRALDEEPLALPLGRSAVVPLDFAGKMNAGPLPTGIYRCTLRGGRAGRVQDFIHAPELTLRAKSGGPVEVVLPPALSGTYVGFAGSTVDPLQGDGPTGFFCGVRIDIRKNTGELLLAFLPLHREQVLQYAELRPRPDTVWPITNVFLEDPVSLAFDCPLSHADYRMVLHAADGRCTLHPELIEPEDARQQEALLARMRALIQAQARHVAQRPEWFDARYAQLPFQQLPNYENLVSRDHFTRHLGRLARTAVKPIELGAQVAVRRNGKDSWDVRVGRTHGEMGKGAATGGGR